ncbi:Rho termination factor N-terminal domain-containing protein [Picosynechococcus sp. PCC 11901]|uniref:Rho termination factor N-terminal domain-containing protein n=1 Tax=Picosynechococcus sp. PCC 11901 TaxID=2579791 RepID=UPI00143CFDC4|nr:Rho termination factor N-terminal domain-containing protein [Picosynechococcus sp. PCC 11901]
MIFAVVYTLIAFVTFAQSEICNRHQKILYARYNNLKLTTLKQIAKKRGLTRYSRKKKHDLILMLMV